MRQLSKVDQRWIISWICCNVREIFRISNIWHVCWAHLSSHDELSCSFFSKLVFLFIVCAVLFSTSIHSEAIVHWLICWNDPILTIWICLVTYERSVCPPKSEEGKEDINVTDIDFILIFSNYNTLFTFNFTSCLVEYLRVSMLPVMTSTHWMIVRFIVARCWWDSTYLIIVNTVEIKFVYNFVA